MTPARARRARAVVRATVVLAAAAVLALAWTPPPSAPLPRTAPAPVGLGRYELVDTGFLGFSARPPAPGNVAAVAHDRSALVSWTKAVPNTSTVVSYRVYVGGTLRATVSKDTTSTTVHGLTNYAQQDVLVKTYDSDDLDSSNTATTPVTPYDDVAPAAVTGLVATRGDGRATLTWEPESGAESDRAGVRVYVDGALRTSLPTATTTYDVTGLTNDREYAFHLVAYDARPNGYGSPPVDGPNASPPSTTVRATPTDLTPPSAPTAFTAVRGDTTAALTWTAPPETDVGSYKVVDENGVLVASFAAPAASGTATTMTDGRAYRLRIVAVDTHGNHSPASAEVTVTPAAPPIARTGLVATRGDTRVALRWDPPTGDPRSAAAVSIRVLVDGAVRATVAGAASTHTVTGLTNDVEHAFSLVAVDAEGRTSAETVRVRATPTDLTPPSAPTALAAERGDAQAALTWTAPPEGDVGSHRVLAQDGSTLATITAPATTHTLTGLTNGTTYRLRLVAVDTHGNVSAPTGVVAVTPLAPPLPITGLTAAAQGGHVDLAWDPPASASGHEDAVQVQVWRVGSPAQLLATVPAAQRSYRWNGYAPGTAESFYVVAVDADPRPSAPSATASTALAPPQDVSASVESERTRITWTSVLGATGYRVERTGGGTTVVGTTSGPFLDVTGLTNGAPATFRVLALDGGRVSAPSTDVTVTPLALPAVVAGLRAERPASGPSSTVVLSWTAPAPPPSDVAATTRVRVFRVGSPGAEVGTVDVPATTLTAADQPTDPRPRYYVVAFDAYGRSSAASQAVVTALGAPQGVTGASGTTSATISWAAVAGATGYRVDRFDGSAWVAAGTTTTATTLTIDPLDKVEHRFRVVATAPGEESGVSAEITVRVGRTPPTTVPAGGSGGAAGVAASRDGRWAVLAVKRPDGATDLVRVDRLGTGRDLIVGGVDADHPGAGRAAVSGDGRYVVVLTDVPHAARDTNGTLDLYRYDVRLQTWALVSGPPGTEPTGAGAAVVAGADTATIDTPDQGPVLAVSDDGAQVFFLSARPDLVPDDTDASLDLFRTTLVTDATTGAVTSTTTRLTVPGQDRPTPVGSGFATTPGGRYAVYAAELADSGAGSVRLVRQDLTDGTLVEVTAPTGDVLQPERGAGQIAVSDDGRRVLAVTSNVPSGNQTLVQADLSAPTGRGTAPPAVKARVVALSTAGGGQVAIAPSGSHAFLATGAALLTTDTNRHVDVYRVTLTGATSPVLVTAGTGGTSTTVPGEGGATTVTGKEQGAITARDADHVVVVTQRPLIDADTNRLLDAYAVDLSAAAADRAHPLVGATP